MPFNGDFVPFQAMIVSAERLELSTNGLKGHCSTIELRARGGAGCPGGLHSIMQGGWRQQPLISTEKLFNCEVGSHAPIISSAGGGLHTPPGISRAAWRRCGT